MNEYDSNRIADLAKKLVLETKNLERNRLLHSKYMSHKRKSYRKSLS